MKLTDVVLRLSNHIKFHNIPGNILNGKHRIWPKLTPKVKRYYLRRIDCEIENMKMISQPFISKEQSELVDAEIMKEKQERTKLEIREKKRASRSEMQDRLFSEQFDILRGHRRWE